MFTEITMQSQESIDELNWVWFTQTRKKGTIKIVCIVDLSVSKQNVTANISNALSVIQVMLAKRNEKLKDYRIVYKDSAGYWHGVSFETLMTGAPDNVRIYGIGEDIMAAESAINALAR